VVVGFIMVGGSAATAGPGGSISGRVVDGSGTPVSGFCVNVENGPSGQTDGSGVYTIGGVSAGSHRVQYSDCRATPQYVTQWYLGHPDSGSAELVGVIDGADTPLADVQLALGVSVSGTVTDTNHAPIAGIAVNVNPTNPGSASVGAQTDASGNYTTSPALPGDYKVQFSDNGPTPTWAREYFNQKPSWNTADTVTLKTTDGSVHGGIDAQLSAGATVEGTATGPGGISLPGICVDANVPNNGGYDGVGSATTASDGTYRIEALPATGVRIRFHDCNGGPYVEQWFDAKADFNSSTPVVLTAGTDRRDVNAQLVTGVSVAGHVTDTHGNPIAGISVNVNPTNSGSGGWAQTDSTGGYTTTAVIPGDYRVQFTAPGPNQAWASQYWNAKPSWNNADILTLAAGDAPVRGGVDAQLSAAAAVTGTVTAAGGGPAAGVCVSAQVDSPNGSDWVGGATSATDGTYTIGGVPATAVKIDFRDCNAVGPYVEQYWNDKPDFSSAVPLTLAPGEKRSGIDAQLAAAAEITGTVTDLATTPLEGICVQATTGTFVGGLAHTDSHGNYVINLATPGDYRVQFVDCTNTPTFAGQWWDGQPGSATASIVKVATGHVVTSINAALSPGAVGTISGTVVNSHHVAMSSACVIAYLPNQYAIFAPVHADGTYTVAGVPSGTYALAFVGCSGGNPSQTVQDPESSGTTYDAVWWHGVPLHLDANSNNGGPDPIAQGANLVTLQSAQDRTGYDWCFGCAAASTPARLAFSTEPGGGTEGKALATQPVVSIQNAAGHVLAGNTSPVTLSITPGTGSPGATLTCTTNPVTGVNGMARFGGCSIDRPGTGYTLTAVTDGLVATSTSFDVQSTMTPIPTPIFGQDAIATAIAVSQAEFPGSSSLSLNAPAASGLASAVVLARSDFFSDALAGGPLAAKVDGPLLITPGASASSSVDPRVLAEIQRVLPAGKTVYLLGGPLALDPGIDTALTHLGFTVQRIRGANEFATAVEIASVLGNPSTIFEATGLNFPDPLSAVPAAIHTGGAILLTNGSTQAPETATYLAAHPPATRYAIGGPLAAFGADPSATPVFGPDAFGTSAAVATTFFPHAAIFGAATGLDYPDALTGAVYMATGGRLGPVLLVNTHSPLPPTIAAYLGQLGAGAHGYVFGGPLAVAPDVFTALQAASG